MAPLSATGVQEMRLGHGFPEKGNETKDFGEKDHNKAKKVIKAIIRRTRSSCTHLNPIIICAQVGSGNDKCHVRLIVASFGMAALLVCYGSPCYRWRISAASSWW